jgi:hypothetical protein
MQSKAFAEMVLAHFAQLMGATLEQAHILQWSALMHLVTRK